MSKKMAFELKEIVENNYTGKQSLETTVSVRTGLKRVHLPENVMVFQRFAFLAATKLKPGTNKILMLFFSKCAYENYIGMDIKTISEELEMSERHVITGLKELHDNNIIIKIKNISDARRHDYFINPIAAWRGNSFTRKQQITKLTKSDPNQLQMFEETSLKSISANKQFDDTTTKDTPVGIG